MKALCLQIHVDTKHGSALKLYSDDNYGITDKSYW